MPSNNRFVISIFSACSMILCSGFACGQAYPTKPIHIIAGSAGGGNDFTGRLIGQGISGPLGQPAVIDNVAGGSLGSALAALRAPPDGYTIVVIGGAVWITPLLEKKPSYDAVADFAAITQISRGPSIVAVHPSVPVKSVKELIALAKARPGEMNFHTSVIGGSVQLATGLFKSMTGINIVEVPYKGGQAGTAGVVAGEVHATINDVSLIAPFMKIGKLRGLAVTSITPSQVAPELLTVSASGLPGYEYVGATNMLAPAKTPAAIINRLNQEIVRALVRPEAKEQFLIRGEEVVADSPEHFAATIKSENIKWSKVIKEAGIKAE